MNIIEIEYLVTPTNYIQEIERTLQIAQAQTEPFLIIGSYHKDCQPIPAWRRLQATLWLNPRLMETQWIGVHIAVTTRKQHFLFRWILAMAGTSHEQHAVATLDEARKLAQSILVSRVR